jgi:small-conductance mechanosensitive channel/CRP-like cAMP-binding protein
MLNEALSQGTPFILLLLVITLPLVKRAPAATNFRSRVRLAVLLVGFHLLFLPMTGVAIALHAGVAKDFRLLGSIAGAMGGVALAGLLLFGVLAPRMRLALPRIVQDIAIAAVSIFAVFGTAARAGVDLTGIVATGAVVTAVIGLALQDTLGNVVGGLALQLDNTVRVGDWIRVLEVTGRVVEIRWRSTSIETPAWETVVLPNSVLTRSQVTVLGRRSGESPRVRSSTTFSVDFRTPPTQVIEVVLRALNTHPIDNLADNPPIECLLTDVNDSAARYTVRFWILDPGRDESTDSVVRTRIYFALKRAGIPHALPAHALFVTEDSRERQLYKEEAERARRAAALAEISLLRDLSAAERLELTDSLQHAPYAKGEVLTRQGSEAHHLYLVTKGRVSVRSKQGMAEREIAQMGPGEFFGEMSLLTGQPRSATIVALTEVECYRLPADAFRKLLERRDDLAAKIASQLAERRVALNSSNEQLTDRNSLVEVEERDLLAKIRTWFGL